MSGAVASMPAIGQRKAAARTGASSRAETAPRAVLVLGMHRSGTSAVARMLNLLGVELGETLMPPSPDNPRGYWEHHEIVAIHDQLLAALGARWDDVRPLPPQWLDHSATAEAIARLGAILQRDFAAAKLWGLKDPRLCRLVPLWQRLLGGFGVAPHAVLVLRHPAEVVQSLAARDGLSTAAAALLWLRHMLEAERATRGQPRAVLSYTDLLGGSEARRGEADRVAAQLGLEWPNPPGRAEPAISAFLTSALRHHYAEQPSGLGAWVDAADAALRAPAIDTAACDAIAAELARADELWPALVTRTRAAVPVTGAAASATKPVMAATTPVAVPAPPAGLAPLSPQEAYARWIEGFASIAMARPDWIAERVAAWPRQPRIVLGMVAPAGVEAHVAASIGSLQQQLAGDWHLIVAAEAATPPTLAGAARLTWHQIAAEPLMAALNRALLEAEGDWLGLIDAGDALPPHALFSLIDAGFCHPGWQAIYSDEDHLDAAGQRTAPHFKPDFNLDLMRSMPYVGALLLVQKEIFGALGGFDPARDGLEDYDLALKLAERLGAAGFGHVADVLYHRAAGSGRTRRPLAEILKEGPATVAAHLTRLGIDASIEFGRLATHYHVRYRHAGANPTVSIIVPTKDRLPLLRRCIETVLEKTAYANYEIIIVDNGSTAPDARAYLELIEAREAEIGSRLRVLRHPGPFNFSAMNNRAVREAVRGDYLCLLNNDIAVLDPSWLDEMMMLARRPEVGAVGAKLFFPDGSIQHAGVILGIGGGMPAEHPFIGEPGDAQGYWGRLLAVQDMSAVTGACLVTRRDLWDEVGGLDEAALADNYNDIDYCLKLRRAGYLVVWTPYAQLLHEGGASRRGDVEGQPVTERGRRFEREIETMYRRWLPAIASDPAYNPNLGTLGRGFDIEADRLRSWSPDFRPRPRAIAYAADRDACGTYRIVMPSRALFDAGLMQSAETMRLMTLPELERIAPDTIVFQRQIELHQIENIERTKRFSRAFRIFELDDLLTNLPMKSAHRKTIPADVGQRLRRALAACDRLVVSTEPLARAYGRMCDEVVVVPNRLDRGRWQGLPALREAGGATGGKPRVGWAGALGHAGDLALIASVVEETAREVDWIFFGMCPEALRPFVKEFHDWVPIDKYPGKLAELALDLAIAPLEHNAFNEAKSNLRLLDYGILGVPVVCMDILPYQGALPVRRVPNRHRDWVRAIREMVTDREACHAQGARLREAVLADWMLDQHLDEWSRAWQR